MSHKQLLDALKSRTKGHQIKASMQQKLKENKELVKFKIKTKQNKPKYYTLEASPALNKIRKDFAKLPKQEQMQLQKELESSF